MSKRYDFCKRLPFAKPSYLDGEAIITMADIGRFFGLSERRRAKLSHNPDFPAPIIKLSPNDPAWRLSDFLGFFASQVRELVLKRQQQEGEKK